MPSFSESNLYGFFSVLFYLGGVTIRSGGSVGSFKLGSWAWGVILVFLIAGLAIIKAAEFLN